MKTYLLFIILFLGGCHLSLNMDKFKNEDQLIQEERDASSNEEPFIPKIYHRGWQEYNGE